MHPILKRILVNGSVTAGVLALIGIGLTELAGLWLLAKAPVRAVSEAPVAAQPLEDPTAAALKQRVPVMLAIWGFAFVAAGEGIIYWWRGNRPASRSASPAELKPDPAEVLLEEILAQVEAAKSTPAETPPSPSSVPAENTPVAS